MKEGCQEVPLLPGARSLWLFRNVSIGEYAGCRAHTRDNPVAETRSSSNLLTYALRPREFTKRSWARCLSDPGGKKCIIRE